MPILIAVTVSLLGYFGAGIRIWVAGTAIFFYLLGASTGLWFGLLVIAILFGVPLVRRLLSGLIMRIVELLKFLPSISQTEQEAIDAGTVWVEGELFSGKPNFKRILNEGYPGLTEKEQAFLDGPVQEICDAVDDWTVHKNRELPPHVWDLLRKHRLFGMIIAEEYGGLGFSASANSAVVGKMAAANTTLGITVMVPNSLGPAELITHYGTQKQKDYYLPRLASHEEIPAFGLTEPQAGSDAGAITSNGVVFRGDDGVLYLKLNWRKRYITLISVATVIGLAFKLRDPENLLGLGENPGITCALINTNLPGVDNSRRHDPMGIPFHNGPTTGVDVILPLEDTIIGGAKGAGQGWKMLMESLAAGRGISLPAASTFSAKMVARLVGAHGVVRRQFGLSIGKFEGVEEKIAEIAGFTYILEAARRYTNGALDEGGKPAVVTAIMKYNATELYRKIINNGMDILGGNAISMGPRNVLALSYINTPIGITVEGANILTRTLIIFGQGAIRSHQFILDEIQSLTDKDVTRFDRAFWGHIGLVNRNIFRALFLSVTRGRLASSPVRGPSARYFRKLAWASASFAVMADVALFSLGGELKRKEKLTGRYADIFSWLYLGAAVLKRFEAEGQRKEDEAFMEWSMDYAFARIQEGFDGLFSNFTVPGISWILQGPVGLWSRINRFGRGPSDKTGHQIAVALQTPGNQRDRHTDGIYLPTSDQKPLGRMDKAMTACFEADKLLSIVKKASRNGSIKRGSIPDMVAEAVDHGIISAGEAERIEVSEALREDAIQVDDFSIEEYKVSISRNTVEQ
ncbi:MAG: acyl-CoA dehydrogenase [Bacteroidetes bacterium]|nr:MAG: acyl-CoA dehydrogenase [Bacteroidota bacterium]